MTWIKALTVTLLAATLSSFAAEKTGTNPTGDGSITTSTGEVIQSADGFSDPIKAQPKAAPKRKASAKHPAPKAPKVVEAEVLQDEDLEVRARMVEWSRQIGVTCTHCHNVQNFKSFEKPAMQVAQAHSRWVQLLNREGAYKITNRPGIKVDCYMCHKGQPVPDFKEKLIK